MSLMSRRNLCALMIAAVTAAVMPPAVAAPTVWVRFVDGNVREWFPVPMWNNTVEQTIAHFSVGWSDGIGGKDMKVETCVTYGDQKP